MLDGYKTYIVGITGVISALAALVTELISPETLDGSLETYWFALLAAIGAMTIRHGMKTGK